MKKVGIIIVIAVLLFAYPVGYKNSSETINITVKEKERAVTGSGNSMSSKFLVYCEGEVFENTDSWMFFKFNSSDLENELEAGKTYTVTVAGWRIPFWSSYRNIIEIHDGGENN